MRLGRVLVVGRTIPAIGAHIEFDLRHAVRLMVLLGRWYVGIGWHRKHEFVEVPDERPVQET